MSRGSITLNKISGAYWRLANIQDNFWQRLVPDFVKPLQRLYADPVSAGVHIVAAYIADPDTAQKKFLSNPPAFGRMAATVPSPEELKKTFDKLNTSTTGLSLETCARHFTELSEVGTALAQLRRQNPILFAQLQNERRARKDRGASTLTQDVMFFGKPVEVAKIDPARRPRKRKTKLKKS